MLRTRLLLVVAVALAALGAGAGAVSAAPESLAPVSGPVHGACTFSTLTVQIGDGSFSAAGSASCVANGVTTPGSLILSGRVDSDLCAARIVTASAMLTLDRFSTFYGAARVATHGPTASVVIAGGLTGTGEFAEVLRGLCPGQTVWTGALVF